MKRWPVFLVAALLVIGGVLPVALYGWLMGRVPTRMAAEAIRALNQEQAVLVDARPAADFARNHVEGAISIPSEQILAWDGPDDLPPQLADRSLYLICDSGWNSARAVDHLNQMGIQQVYNARGGMQEWAKAAWRVPDLAFTRFSGEDAPGGIPVKALPPWEQFAQVFAGFGIKPLYMLLCLALALLLWFHPAADLKAMCWGLLFFEVGEFFCYVNFLAFRDDSYLSEFLHSYGMVVGFAFLFYAAMEGFETRFLHANDINKRCGALAVCLRCSRYSQITCRARRVYQLAMPVLALLAFMPLTAPFNFDGYNGSIAGFQYYYARFGPYQFYENRLLPLLALACFAAAYAPLWLPRGMPLPRLSQILLSAGLGALSFSLVRLALGRMYADSLVWFDFWEESTELVLMLAIAALLWTFRVALFPRGVMGKLFSWFHA